MADSEVAADACVTGGVVVIGNAGVVVGAASVVVVDEVVVVIASTVFGTAASGTIETDGSVKLDGAVVDEVIDSGESDFVDVDGSVRDEGEIVVRCSGTRSLAAIELAVVKGVGSVVHEPTVDVDNGKTFGPLTG